MLRRLVTLVAIFVAAIGTWAGDTPKVAQSSKPRASAAQSSAKPAKAKSHKVVKGRKKPSAEKVEQAQTPPPPPPPTLEQQPPVVPEVVYRGGVLTITARNSTMSDVLNAVRRVTGAPIERPPGSGSERVVGVFGPGAPKDVLSQLLNGSRYDYIILGSATRPGGIDRVMLTLRSNAGPAAAVAANSSVPRNNPPPDLNQDQESEPDTDMEDETAPETEQPPAETAPEQQAVPVQPPLQPGNPPSVQSPPDQPSPNQQRNPNQVKTPEELLRELQQMQQQQQQHPPDNNPPQ